MGSRYMHTRERERQFSGKDQGCGSYPPVDIPLRDRYRQRPLGLPPRLPRHLYATSWQDDEYSSDYKEEQRPQLRRKGKGNNIEALAKAISEQTHNVHLKVPEFTGKFDTDPFIEWLDKVDRIFNYKKYGDPKQVMIIKSRLISFAIIWWNNVQQAVYIRLPSHYRVVENMERAEGEVHPYELRRESNNLFVDKKSYRKLSEIVEQAKRRAKVARTLQNMHNKLKKNNLLVINGSGTTSGVGFYQAPPLIDSLPPGLHFALLPLLRTAYSSKWTFLIPCTLTILSDCCFLCRGHKNVPTEDVHVDEFTLLDCMLYKAPWMASGESMNWSNVDVIFEITPSKAEKMKQSTIKSSSNSVAVRWIGSASSGSNSNSVAVTAAAVSGRFR
ncbi:hypothetical protein GIB67_041792 [Kingdonia uniflora]|uniref:Uncharacterized protein n=1 Tax=Kingdonia uniflora TaxID=39325 RepID=A0A7J7L5S9_9MAGN|nr:hypothetical protein GIB67_041792 [Kingdonia uniflora]